MKNNFETDSGHRADAHKLIRDVGLEKLDFSDRP